MKRALVPAVPFFFSLLLSACTVGTTVFWQDSGYYLTAVHDMSVLYPHGFVLYQVLCKGWTLAAAPLFGFTLAVHLFSSLAAAAGASFAALAARDFLRKLDPARSADLPAIGAACILAAGYCYGHAAIIAKCYALYYALLLLLLWLMVRSETRRDFLLMGAVLGFSWAAHPSAALLVPGMLAYGAVRRDRIREFGWPFFAGVVAIAAACAFAPALLLPVLSARESLGDFGAPRTLGEIIRYISGQMYTGQEGAFGFTWWRWTRGLRYAWEEYLGGGLALLLLGSWALWRTKPRMTILFAAWTVPFAVVTLLFKGEGQFDQWLVVVFLPLTLPTALGLSWLLERRRGWGLAAAGVALAWPVAANVPSLSQRGDDCAEQYGRMLLRNLDPGSVILFSRDDGEAICRYLQRVRGERPDVVVLRSSRLGEEWLDRRILQQKGIPIAPYRIVWGLRDRMGWEMLAAAVFAHQNHGVVPAIFTDLRPSEEFLGENLTVVQAGMLWKVVSKKDAAVDPRYWDYPVQPESIRRKGRRQRAHWTYETSDGVDVRAELYEDRFFLPLLWSRVRFADLLLPREPARALALYDSVLAIYPEAAQVPRFVYHRGVALYSLGRSAEADAVWRSLLASRPPPEIEVFVLFYLGELARERRNPAEASEWYRRALLKNPPPELRPALEQRLRGP